MMYNRFAVKPTGTWAMIFNRYAVNSTSANMFADLGPPN